MNKGWDMINDQTKGLEGGKYANIHNNSGVWTIGDDGLCSGVPDSCKPYIDRKIGAKIVQNTTDFDEFETSFGEITKIRYNTSCNEEMLVMWFNNDGRSGYNNYEYECILDDNHIFDIKNVDECEHLIYCQSGESNTFRATNAYVGSSGSQKFPTTSYKDSGYPYISTAPCIGDYTQKYLTGTQYNGHKIKYRPTDETIPANFYKGHDELVELYFPHMYDGNDDGKNTKTIDTAAFSRCSRLSAVTFSSVSAINAYAFSECDLKSIDWGHHVSNKWCKEPVLKKIGAYAFYKNINLKCLNLPNSLTEIGERAFYFAGSNSDDDERCKIYIPSSVTKIGCSAFTNMVESYIRWEITDTIAMDNNTEICDKTFSCGETIHVYLPNITCQTFESKIKPCFDNYDDNVYFYINIEKGDACLGDNVFSTNDWQDKEQRSPEFPFKPIS